MPSAYQSRVLADGAQAYWPLDDAVGSPTAHDLAGTRTATARATVTFGQPGPGSDKAALLDVTGQFNPATFPSLATTFTVECWGFPGAIPGATPRALVTRQTLANGDFQFEWRSVNVLRWSFFSGSAQTVNTANGVITSAIWSHLVMTGASGQVQFYVNGTPIGASTAMTLSGAGAGLPAIGGYAEAGAETWGWGGVLADVAIYPTALTPTVISQHYTLRTAADTGGQTHPWWVYV
jgi:hypothetical protein